MATLASSAATIPSLVALTTKEELLSWAKKIKTCIPHCTSMYNNLLLHGDSYISLGTFYILQGQPDKHSVVFLGRFEPKKQHFALFCLEEEVDQLIEALKTASFIDWHKKLTIHYIPPYLLDHLEHLARENCTDVSVIPCITFTYHPHLDTQSLRIDPGFRVCQLGKAGIHRMLQEQGCKCGGTPPLDVMNALAQQLPFVGVYQDSDATQDMTVDPNNLPVAGDEEIPVAWVCTNFLGDVGRVMTERSYRRRGISSLITTAVARQQAALQLIPHAFIEVDNTASCEMFTRLPGWKLTHDTFWLHTKGWQPPSTSQINHEATLLCSTSQEQQKDNNP